MRAVIFYVVCREKKAELREQKKKKAQKKKERLQVSANILWLVGLKLFLQGVRFLPWT